MKKDEHQVGWTVLCVLSFFTELFDSMAIFLKLQADSSVYFDKNVFLTVSGQLHLEAMCNGIAKVYTFNQVFR
jgi:hypothetical protein